MGQSRRKPPVTALLLVALAASTPPAAAQLQWKSPDEQLAFKIGLLAQMQAESIEIAGTGETAENLFLRRLRLMMGFTLGEKLSVFLDTDSPNLGKSGTTGTKDAGDVYIQDLVATWRFDDDLHVDAGMILLATSYNHGQGAASLLPVDYGPYTFFESVPIGARMGRDYGVQARGYLLEGDRLEYRAGVFEGLRGENAANSLRTNVRLMYQLFTPQKGLFYRGTSHGRTKTVSFGLGYDAQEEYDSLGLDLFADLPVGDGDGLTFQADWLRADGGDFIPGLPEQTNLLVEAGWYFAGARLQPFAQYAEQDFADPARIDETKWTVGLGLLPGGHNNALKLGYSRIEPAQGETRDQIVLQWQVYQF